MGILSQSAGAYQTTLFVRMTGNTYPTASSRPGQLGLVLYLAMAALIVVEYHLLGNSIMPEIYSRSAFGWMVSFWNYTGGFGGVPYRQGWVLPLISLWLIWRQRAALRAASKGISYAGLALLVVALFAHWVGVKSQQTRFSLLALVLMLWSIPFYLGGRRVAWLLLFPIALLIFCVPLNFFDSALFPLRIAAANVAAALLNGLGLDVQNMGSTIMTHDGFRFEAADAAGSLRNVLGLVSLAALIGHLRQRTPWKQWAVFLLGLPLALLANIIRLVVVGLTAGAAGAETATWLQVHIAGPMVLAVGALLIFLASVLLNKRWSSLVNAWKSALTPTTSLPSPYSD